MPQLLLFFIIMPILEMLLLFEVAEHIGGLSTVGLVMLTAVIGLQILRMQGFSTFTRANSRLAAGELPAQEIFEGLFLAVGGAFLLTPGFITDTLGFLFLIGPSRRFLVRRLIKSGKMSMFTMGPGNASYTYSRFTSKPRSDQGNTFEGEFTDESDNKHRIDPP